MADSDPISAANPRRSSSASSIGSSTSGGSESPTAPQVQPIRPSPARQETGALQLTATHKSEEEIFRILSRRRTSVSSHQEHDPETNAEIENLLSSIFGNARGGGAGDGTRHLGVVFKGLTVKGQGIGASVQPTVKDILLGPWRAVKGLSRKRTKLPVRTLIDGFEGCVRPGEMLLVLGRPGSGCSTFLKVIGNQRNGFVDITGDVLYGGTDYKTMQKKFRGEVLYNPEDDLHYPTLTVRDTLKFALETRTPDKSSRQEGESRKDYVNEFLRVVSKLFWIEHTLDTKVGNELVRGVSGGEKKRVSIAEALVTKASCQCWDNSTKGLDASTAIEYVESLRTLSNMANISNLVALYQAGESLYDLFDKVLLIDQGRCAYFGPTENAKAYFEGLGFVCPPRWTTADFLTSVTDRHERQVKEGWEDRVPRNAEELSKAYRASEVAAATQRDIADFESTLAEQRKERMLQATERARTQNYAIPFHKQVAACTKRQFKVMLGDPMSLGGKWGGVLFQSLIVGSLFYNLPGNSNGVFPRSGVLFFTLLFNSLLALAELTAAFSSIPILLKHKSFSFYRPSAYAVALVAVDLPLCAVQVTIWNIVVYFMADLQRTASQFFVSLLVVFVTTLSMYSLFRMIGSFSADLDVATRITGVSLQALIVYAGYLIPPSSMHPWFSWIRWINPVQYGFEAIMANEFYNLDIKCVPPYLVPIGPGVEPRYQSCTLQGNRPGSAVVSGADYIRTQFTYTRAHLWRNVGVVIAFWIFFVVMTAVGLESKKPNSGGAAVTVFKRGEAPAAVEKAMQAKDEEAAEKEPASNGEGGDGDDNSTEGVAKNDSVFTWQGVTYTIPVKDGHKTLLKDVQGYVRPGKLTALMGESGAGKTTLLNTLAQRIDFGKVEGNFMVDGKPLPKSFQRTTGFAEQQDVHEPTATVREALRFSALLRQPVEVPVQEKYDYVEKIIKLLEMQDIAGATVGSQGSGLNQEQRKRLTIGVELASKPELLMFLDEPTSGLDSNAAFNVVRFLRKLADSGQAILCTIHQPSAVLFEHFDDLILLKSGGRVVYHGPLGHDSHIMIRYFEEHGGPICPKDKNPAEYMLEAIGTGDPNRRRGDWAEVWDNSEEHEQRSREIAQFITERSKAGSGKTEDGREFAMPLSSQIFAVVKRTFISYWRTPQYIIGKFALHIFTGLFNSFTFYKLGNTSIDMQNRLFSIFMTITISPPLIQQLQPKFLHFRQLFMARERASMIYHWSAFTIGAVLVEIPYNIVAGTIYFVAWYFPTGFPRDSFSIGYTWLMLMIFELYYTSFGQAIASFSANELLASLLVPVFFIFTVAFCGVVVPYVSIPAFWKFVYWVSPFHYMVEGLLGVLAHDVPVRCASQEFATFPLPEGSTCKSYAGAFVRQVGGYVEQVGSKCRYCRYNDGDGFNATFNIFYNHSWRDFGLFCAYVVFNFVVVFVSTWLYVGGGGRMLGNLKKKWRASRGGGH